MNDSLRAGSVVICPTTQSGCIVFLNGKEACVLLLNLCLWHGNINMLREPQDPEDLAACPLEVERFEGR